MTCDSCSKKLKLKAEHAGKKIRCPACQKILQVPAAGAAGEPLDAIPVTPPKPRRKKKRVKKVATVDDDMWEDDDDLDDEWDDTFDANDPYAPPQSRNGNNTKSFGSGKFSVDGKLIKCGPKVSLPKICVKTGAKKNLVAVKKTLKHAPAWAWIGGVILVLLNQKSCEVKYYISKAVKKQSTLLMTGGIAGFILGVVLCVGGPASRIEWLVLPGLVLLIGGIIVAMIASTPLKISKRDGAKVFWLAGCKPEFLKQVGR